MGRRRKFTNEFKLGAVQLAERLTSEEHDEPIRLPVRSPDLNAYGEGWIRSPRQECLDRIVLLREAHLRWVLREYVRYHDERRAHQSLGHLPPEASDGYPSEGRIAARPALGDLINDCSASPPNGVLSPRYRPGLLVCAWRDPWRSPWQALPTREPSETAPTHHIRVQVRMCMCRRCLQISFGILRYPLSIFAFNHRNILQGGHTHARLTARPGHSSGMTFNIDCRDV